MGSEEEFSPPLPTHILNLLGTKPGEMRLEPLPLGRGGGGTGTGKPHPPTPTVLTRSPSAPPPRKVMSRRTRLREPGSFQARSQAPAAPGMNKGERWEQRGQAADSSSAGSRGQGWPGAQQAWRCVLTGRRVS